MMRRLAIALVQKYPQPWRDRYGDEVLELLRESPARLSDVSELFRGLIVERARALIEDADHPQRAIRILSALPPAFLVTFIGSAWGLATALKSWRSFPQPFEDFGPALFVSWIVGWEVVCWRQRRRRRLTWLQSPDPQFQAWLGATILPVLFAVIVMIEWSGWRVSATTMSSQYPQFYIGMIAAMRLQHYVRAVSALSASFWPRQRLLEAFGQLLSAETGVKEAQEWVASCNIWIATGVPSPLTEAEEQLREARARVELCREQRDAALGELNSLGYRARLERS